MNYIIREAVSEDKNSILQLLRESFSGYWSAAQAIYSEEFWDWLYRDNPGKGSLNFIAEDKGKVIGHFPNVFMPLKVAADNYLSATVLHLTTHPDYRRRGIFENLGRKSWEELAGRNVMFSLAFPNDRSRPGFLRKLGFSPIGNLAALVRPLKMENILRTILKKPLLSQALSFILEPAYQLFFYGLRLPRQERALDIESDTSIGPEFDAFWDKLKSQAKVMVPRDSAFLNWRFSKRPGQDYRIITACKNGVLQGYLVSRKASMFSLGVGIIMDFLTLPDSRGAFEALLRKALGNFQEEGLDICLCACLKNNPYYRSLRKERFVVLPDRFNPRKLVLVGRVNQDNSLKETFLDKKNWFLTFADWDVL